MRRKLVILSLMIATAIGTWTALPFVTAWQIRQAVRAGDSGTLSRKVDWVAVRQSLKASVGETRLALGELAEAGGLERPSWWQRVKTAALPYLADPLIDRYVTAEGVHQLYQWRQAWRKQAPAALIPAQKPTLFTGTRFEGGALDRNWALMRRVERWAFVAANRFEIEIAGRYSPNRRWFAALKLQGYEWRLVEVRALRRGDAEPTGKAAKALSTSQQ